MIHSGRRTSTLFIALAALTPTAFAAPKPPVAYQYSTLPALGAGLFDGGLTFKELLKHGNFGLGTFQSLDGELIILDGQLYRATPGGPTTPVDKKTSTPFAIITDFKPDTTIEITTPTDFATLGKQITAALPTLNRTYAIEITGTFERIKVRSVHRQNKPYPTLAEVTKTQTVTEWTDQPGTLVGFRYPAFLSGVNLPDLHFHFLTADRKNGGHMLDCKLKTGTVKIQSLRDIEIHLPDNADFDKANLSVDTGAAFKAAEAAGGK